jgi:diguanylate cyclase (GGDEF)-like protein
VTGVANSANYHLKIVKDAQRALSKLAMTDYLSGLPNRTAFSILFEEKLIEAIEKKKSLGMMMIDVDYFKDLNDTYGHLCGDAILKSLSELLMSQKTGHELIARFGGEEFVFLEICDEENHLLEKAEVLRKHIESHEFIYQSNLHPITVSIGALWIQEPHIEDSISYIDQADGLMYQAKEQGRNKVVQSSFYKIYKGV